MVYKSMRQKRFLRHRVQTASGPTQPPVHRVLESLFTGAKWPGMKLNTFLYLVMSVRLHITKNIIRRIYLSLMTTLILSLQNISCFFVLMNLLGFPRIVVGNLHIKICETYASTSGCLWFTAHPTFMVANFFTNKFLIG